MTFCRNTLKTALGVALVGSLAFLTACSPSAAEGGKGQAAAPVVVPGASAEANEHLNSLYKKALESGKTDIVMYGPAPSAYKALHQVFLDRFPGINIVPQDQADAQTLTKLDVEAESGNRIADLYVGGEAPQAAAKDNICMPADIRTAPAGFELPVDNDGKLLRFALRYFGFVYNTDMVKEEEAPKSWHDLLDPKWKGKILIGDPTVPGGIRYILTSMMLPETQAEWGKPYMEQLAAQELNFSQSEPTVSADVASGRFPIGIGVYSGYYYDQKAKGAPLDMVFPLTDGGNFLARSGLCQIQDSPHADATSLYLNWMFTQEGQNALGEKDNSYGVLPTAPGPSGAPAFADLKKLPYSNPDPEFNKEYFDYIVDLFKKS
ncbi:ABC transporter substrate-binding protein [Arthrobacter ginkgonis]|uniref:ABC transporter substrate-binding protein n=1 Tax=Arthrobacter ginkgonis TaxID=1630594 RepID=A0ABP7D5Y0_9MICC